MAVGIGSLVNLSHAHTGGGASVAEPGGVISHGDIGAIEALEIDLLLEGLYQLHGADFRGYARAPLTLRLRAYLGAQGLATISALQDSIMRSRSATETLVHTLSLRPAAMFEDPSGMRTLREALCPYLRSCALPKIWIAESTSAEDVFALVIMLVEEGLYDKTLIFVTAADDVLLDETRRGMFDAERLPTYEENYRRSGGRAALAQYCSTQDGRLCFAPSLRKNLIWAQYDLTTDRSFNEFQLIVCRRVLPEFGAGLQRRSLRLFADSLSQFGLLSVDVPEDVDNLAPGLRFQTVSRVHGLYRRSG